jgi:tetratricopeptide (TPR) repeat protein
MSLLLDALQRASKDKEKAALAAANAAAAGAQADGKIRLTPPTGQATADFPQLASAKEELPAPSTKPPEPPPLQPITSVEEPMELELELEPKPIVAVSTVPLPVVESPQTHVPTTVSKAQAPVLVPAIVPPPKTSAAVEPLAAVVANPSEAQRVNRANPDTAAGPSAKPAAPANTKATANAIQNAYATPVSGKSPRSRRALILGGVATALALGLSSFLFGLWGDPERLLGLTGTSSLAIVSPSLPVQSPAAAPEASASTPAQAADIAIAAKPPAATPVAVTTLSVTPIAGTLPSGSVGLNAGASVEPTVLGAAATPTTNSAPLPTPPNAKPAPTQPKELVMRPTSPPPVFSPKLSSQGSLEQGYAALLEGRLDEAAQAYGAALAANPMERDALLGLAYVAHSKGRREEAQALYRKVLRLEPSNSVANAGLISLAAGSNGATNSDRAKALAARQPDSAAVQVLAASALVQDGLLAEAALAFSRAQGLEPNNPWHSYNLAVALDRLGNYAQALEQYDKALLNRVRSPTPLGAQQVESARLRATQLQQSLEPRSEAAE